MEPPHANAVEFKVGSLVAAVWLDGADSRRRRDSPWNGYFCAAVVVKVDATRSGSEYTVRFLGSESKHLRGIAMVTDRWKNGHQFS